MDSLKSFPGQGAQCPPANRSVVRFDPIAVIGRLVARLRPGWHPSRLAIVVVALLAANLSSQATPLRMDYIVNHIGSGYAYQFRLHPGRVADGGNVLILLGMALGGLVLAGRQVYAARDFEVGALFP